MITYYFPPLGGVGTRRTLKFSQNIVHYGWEPQILTPKKRAFYSEDKDLQKQVESITKVHETSAFLPVQFLQRMFGHKTNTGIFSPQRTGIFSYLRNLIFTLFCKPDEFRGWIPFGVHAGKKIIAKNKIDLIYSSGPPNSCHIIAMHLTKFTHIPWVADLRDLWNMYPHSYNPFSWKWRKLYDMRIELETLIQANHIILTSTEMRDSLIKCLPKFPAAKIHTITNGYDPHDFFRLNSTKSSDVLTIVHAGNLFPWRSLEPVLQSLAVLFESAPKYRHKITIKLAGLIPQSELRLIERYGMQENIQILGTLPHAQTMALVQKSTVLLLLTGTINHAREMIPGKLFEYIGAKKPILSIGPIGASSQIIETENRGWHFEKHQCQHIAVKLKNLLQLFEAGELHFSFNDDSKYQYESLTKDLIKVFNKSIENNMNSNTFFRNCYSTYENIRNKNNCDYQSTL